MNSDALENFVQAGKVASYVRNKSMDIAKDGILLADLAEQLENMILEKGCLPAFPVNLSMNSHAAHYTPTKNEKTAFHKGDMLKVDLGVHIDGCVADTACTIVIDHGKKDLVEASKKALEATIELCKPGMKLSTISATIEDTIKQYGYRPISNLTGHGIGRYDLHAEPQIPNVKTKTEYTLNEDQIIAIEPFATDGYGEIKDSEEVLIFGFKQFRPVRNAEARKVIDFVQKYGNLPFAQRWLETGLNMSEFKLKLAIRELVANDVLNTYPVLVEKAGSFVSQHEHTVVVREEPLVITL